MTNVTITARKLRLAADLLMAATLTAASEKNDRDAVVAWIDAEIHFREREAAIRKLAREMNIHKSDARVIMNEKMPK